MNMAGEGRHRFMVQSCLAEHTIDLSSRCHFSCVCLCFHVPQYILSPVLPSASFALSFS